MGLRWDNERKEFEPLRPWVYSVMGAVIGFAMCYLTLVP